MNINNISNNLALILIILTTIIIGVLVYYSVADSSEMGRVTESFAATNATNVTSTLTYTPQSDTEVNVTYYNSSAATWHNVPSTNWTRTGKTIIFHALNATLVSNYDANLSQVRYRYYSQTGVIVRDNVNPQASTSFTLAPIITIVVIASIILFAVATFGRKPGI